MEKTVALLRIEIAATHCSDSASDSSDSASDSRKVSSGVSLNISMPVGPNGDIGEDVVAEVTLLVATGSGRKALAEVRNRLTATAAPLRQSSLHKIAATVNADKSSSSQGRSAVLFGRHSGLSQINDEFERIARGESIEAVYPTTSSDVGGCSKVKLQSAVGNDDPRHFFCRTTEGIEHAEGKKLYDNQRGMPDMSSASFNAFVPCDPMSQPFGGPGLYLGDTDIRQGAASGEGEGDKVAKALLAYAGVTQSAVEQTALLALSGKEGLGSWLRNLMNSLTFMHCSVPTTKEERLTTKEERLPPDGQAQLTPNAVPAPAPLGENPVAPSPNQDNAAEELQQDPIDPQVEVERVVADSLSADEACREQLRIVRRALAELPAELPADAADPDGERDTLARTVAELEQNLEYSKLPAQAPPAFSAVQHSQGIALAAADAPQGEIPLPVIGENASPAAGPVVDGDEPDSSDNDTQPDTAQPRSAPKRSSSRDSLAEQSNKANNVRLAVTDTDKVNAGVMNALVATKDMKKGDIVMEETVPGSGDMTGIAQYVQDAGLPCPTLEHGGYWVELVGTGKAKSLTYMANHDDTPNCNVTIPSQWRTGRNATVKLVAKRSIKAGEEITHAYNIGDKANPPVFPAKAAPSRNHEPSTSTAKGLPARRARGTGNKTAAVQTPLPTRADHPDIGTMRLRAAKKDGNCFFSAAATQLNEANAPLGGKQPRWGQKMIRGEVARLMLHPANPVEVATVHEVKTAFLTVQAGLNAVSDPEMFAGNGQPITWEDLALDINQSTTWVSPPTIQLFSVLLKVDLCILTVVINEDGSVREGPWVNQLYEGDAMELNGKRFCVYLRYTDDLRGGSTGSTGHYDGWSPARDGLDVHGAPVPSAAKRSEEDVPAETSSEMVSRKRKRGTGKEKASSDSLVAAGCIDGTDEEVARGLALKFACSDRRDAKASAEREAKEAGLANHINETERAEQKRKRTQQVLDDADVARKLARKLSDNDGVVLPQLPTGADRNVGVLDKKNMPGSAPPSSTTGPGTGTRTSKRTRKKKD